MVLFLGGLESGTLVVLEHAVLSAKVPGAEGAVADYALGGVFAVGECAAEFFGGHGGYG